MTNMRDSLEIFSVRLQDPQHFLQTRFAGLATLLTSGTNVIDDDMITVDPSQLLKHFFDFYIA
jgi:hypothetical protein